MYLVLNPPHMQQYIICVLNRKVIYSLVNMRGKNCLHLEKISDAVLSSYKIHCKHTKLCYYACQLLFLLMWTCVVSTAGPQLTAV